MARPESTSPDSWEKPPDQHFRWFAITPSGRLEVSVDTVLWAMRAKNPVDFLSLFLTSMIYASSSFQKGFPVERSAVL
jgi:hypothetical protein